MSEEARLKAGIWVRSVIKICQVNDIACFVLRKGDEDAGAVLIKQNLLGDGFIVLTAMRSVHGTLGWMRGTGPHPVEEPVADAYIARQVNRDSDLWVIEIEDRSGTLPFDHKFIER